MRGKGYPVAGQSVRITVSVRPFVVEADDCGDRLHARYSSRKLGAPGGVELDHAALLCAQRPWLAQDVTGHTEFADVVQSRGKVELDEVERVQPEPLPDAEGEPHHGPGVLGRSATAWSVPSHVSVPTRHGLP